MTAAAQRERELLNCALFLSEFRADDDPWSAIRRLYTRSSQSYLKDAAAAVSDPLLLLDGVYQRGVRRRSVPYRATKVAVDCLVEQVPDPDSRITVSACRDALGMPIPHLHWKISDLERCSVAALAEAFLDEVARAGLEAPSPPDWLRDKLLDAIPFRDMAHPTGTTRIADDPKRGVVDRNCRLHGVDGLYIAGSSVFPTASHANPTLMIVAMTLRLADWLKQEHFG